MTLGSKYIQSIAKHDAAMTTLMRNEHRKLTELLAEARHALITERPVTFRVLMQALKGTMNEHGAIENQLFQSLTSSEFDHEKIISIQRRISENIV